MFVISMSDKSAKMRVLRITAAINPLIASLAEHVSHQIREHILYSRHRLKKKPTTASAFMNRPTTSLITKLSPYSSLTLLYPLLRLSVHLPASCAQIRPWGSWQWRCRIEEGPLINLGRVGRLLPGGGRRGDRPWGEGAWPTWVLETNCKFS